MIKKLGLAARFLGLQKSLRAVQYSLLRDWYERSSAQPGPQYAPVKPGALVESTPGESGSTYSFQHTQLEIHFLAPDLVRLTWGAAPQPPFYALDKTDWEPVQVESGTAGEALVLQSQSLQVFIEKSGALRFADRRGKSLRLEDPPVFFRPGWHHRARLHPEERVYGLGERASGLNLRGGSFHMWNTDPGGSYGPQDDPLYLTIPVALGLHPEGSYLVFYENSHPGTIEVGDNFEARFEGGSLRYYLIIGTPARVLERYLALTGRPPMPPRWALGHHQCRWGYQDEAEIRAVVGGFQEHGLPLSAIHMDIDYMDGYRVFSVDQARFPDLERLTSDLHTGGIRVVTILDPGVKRDPHFAVFKQGLDRDVFLKAANGKPFSGVVWPGWAVFPDFTRPETREWWGENYAGLLEAGVDGFWHDMNEPASFAAWGDPTLPKTLVHEMDGRSGLHREGHNLYGLLMARAGYEGLRRLDPGRRPWLLTRSGWAGVQRYSWHWTGDTETSWRALRMTVRTVLGLSLSGIPYTGPDIGGFSGSPSAELFTRWFQLAAFLPFFRNHAAVGTPPREPWVFGEPHLGIIRDYLRLRKRLEPYFYTLAWLAHTQGQLLIRPLFWPDGIDPALWEVDDAFLLGDALLVAPVLEPQAERRDVILPAGRWYNVWDDRVIEGPGKATLETALDRIPLLARGGSVIPMLEGGILTLHLYAPSQEAGGGMLYSDEGDGYGPWRLDRFGFSQLEDGWELVWDQQGEFLFPFERITIEFHGFDANRAIVDEQELEIVERRLEVGYFESLRFFGD